MVQLWCSFCLAGWGSVLIVVQVWFSLDGQTYGSVLVQVGAGVQYVCDVVRLWCSCGSDKCGLTCAGLALVQIWLIWFRLAQLWVSLGSACCGVMSRDAVVVQLWFSCSWLDLCNVA